MRQFAVSLLVMITILLSSGVKNSMPQEKGKSSEAELKNQKVNSATTTIITPEKSLQVRQLKNRVIR